MSGPLCYPHLWRRRQVALADCLAAGSGGRVAGEVERLGPPVAGPVVLAGISAETAPLLAALRARGDDRWWYVDKGYFGRRSHLRVTRARLQHDGRSGGMRPDRLRDLGVEIRPWRRAGRHVLVCLQSAQWLRDAEGVDRDQWLADVRAALAGATDRPVRVREKSDPRPLAADLVDCWAVVAHSSNAAVEAICAGVPAIVTGDCAARALSAHDPAAVERLPEPDGREEWAARLAANQWSWPELAGGDWWRRIGEG